MRFEHFLTLLKHAQVLVGNSSSGVREAPVYGVPSVNVGTRQLNRYRYPSIVEVPEDEGAILAALAHLPGAVAPSFHFGRGQSARLFANVLEAADVWATPRQKQFRDIPAGRAPERVPAGDPALAGHAVDGWTAGEATPGVSRPAS